MTNHTEWMQTIRGHWEQHGIAYNDAVDYGVKIFPADISKARPGAIYWRIIGVHHLRPEENLGQRVVFLDTVDEDWNVLRSTWVMWTWEGMRKDQSANPVYLDKPSTEPGSNIALINTGMIVHARCTGFVNPTNATYEDQGGLSDWGGYFHTAHGDEEIPGTGQNGNYTGHHSFYVLWKRFIIGEDEPEPTPEPPPEPEPEPEPEPPPVVGIGNAWVHISQADSDYFKEQSSEGCNNRAKVHNGSQIFPERPDGASNIEIIVDANEVAKLHAENVAGMQFVSLFMPLFRNDPE